jgi:hypothetical protein
MRGPQRERRPVDVIASAILLVVQEERKMDSSTQERQILRRRRRQTSLPRNRGEIPPTRAFRQFG